MKPRLGIVFALIEGAALGMLGGRIVVAQQATEQRTVLLASNLVGIEDTKCECGGPTSAPGSSGHSTTTRGRSAFTSSKVP